jgi:hypothetical protein
VQLTTRAGAGTYQFEPSAALDAQGNVFVTYTAGSPLGTVHPLGRAVVYVDGRIERDLPVTTNRENHFDSWMTTGRDGTIYAVWLGFDGPMAPEKRAIIGLSRSKDGSTWSPPTVADDALTDCANERRGCLDKPMVIAGLDRSDPKREALYVFYGAEPEGGMKVVRSTDGGQTFSRSVRVGADYYGSVALSEKGVLHAVYGVGKGQADGFGDVQNRFEYVWSDDGGASFAPPVVVSAPNEPVPSSFSNPQVVADEQRGIVYVVYPAGTPDGRWDIMLASSADKGASWSRIKVNDDASCANHMTPMATLDPVSGRVHIIWLENRTGDGGLAYATCTRSKAPGGATCSPNEAVNDAPFASYVLTRHSPNWLAEYGTLLFDRKRRALHALWTQTVKEPSGTTARIFHASAQLGRIDSTASPSVHRAGRAAPPHGTYE